MSDLTWISESEVVELLDLGDAIRALENGLREEAEGRAFNMSKTHVAWGHNNLHAIGAVSTRFGVAAVKTWAHTAGGATPLLVLIDSQDGSIKAIIEAFALGQMRTGGVSAVATDWLATENAEEVAIIGTGKQALLQVAAVAAVRPVRRLRVFSPRAESRREFIAKVRAAFDFEVLETNSVAEAVDRAEIVTLVTRATAPFLSADMLASGTHVNAVGAITPERAEFAQDVLTRTTRVIVDSVPDAQKLSQELTQAFGIPGPAWDRVSSLAAVVKDCLRRRSNDDVTLFKAMGIGISDLALGAEIYSRAMAAGRGRAIPHPRRAQPRMKVSRATTLVDTCTAVERGADREQTS